MKKVLGFVVFVFVCILTSAAVADPNGPTSLDASVAYTPATSSTPVTPAVAPAASSASVCDQLADCEKDKPKTKTVGWLFCLETNKVGACSCAPGTFAVNLSKPVPVGQPKKNGNVTTYTWKTPTICVAAGNQVAAVKAAQTPDWAKIIDDKINALRNELLSKKEFKAAVDDIDTRLDALEKKGTPEVRVEIEGLKEAREWMLNMQHPNTRVHGILGVGYMYLGSPATSFNGVAANLGIAFPLGKWGEPNRYSIIFSGTVARGSIGALNTDGSSMGAWGAGGSVMFGFLPSMDLPNLQLQVGVYGLGFWQEVAAKVNPKGLGYGFEGCAEYTFGDHVGINVCGMLGTSAIGPTYADGVYTHVDKGLSAGFTGGLNFKF